jgi:hypothetical protein
LKLVPFPPVQGTDLSGGEPFTPPDGTFTVPQVPDGQYTVVVLCGDIGTDSFGFRVTSSTISATPNFAG